MDRQSVLTESLWQYGHHPPGVFLLAEPNDEVVRIANEVRLATQAWLDLPVEPVVQHVMQEDVRKDGRDHPTLRRPGFGERYRPRLHHARLEPFADQTRQHAVTHPLLKK